MSFRGKQSIMYWKLHTLIIFTVPLPGVPRVQFPLKTKIPSPKATTTAGKLHDRKFASKFTQCFDIPTNNQFANSQ